MKKKKKESFVDLFAHTLIIKEMDIGHHIKLKIEMNLSHNISFSCMHSFNY